MKNLTISETGFNSSLENDVFQNQLEQFFYTHYSTVWTATHLFRKCKLKMIHQFQLSFNTSWLNSVGISKHFVRTLVFFQAGGLPPS
jgi:hypothetical protein